MLGLFTVTAKVWYPVSNCSRLGVVQECLADALSAVFTVTPPAEPVTKVVNRESYPGEVPSDGRIIPAEADAQILR